MPLADLIFAAVVLIVIVAIVILLRGKGKATFEAAQKQLAEKGYVVTHTLQRHRGPVTWVWGRYREPIPFYLHFSNRDPIASLAGRAGIADIALGQTEFDAAFFVRSNKPEWAQQFMKKELCEWLLQFENIQFITSSIGNLLTPDYWPEERNRDLRDVWMLRVDGKLEGVALEPYIKLAGDLSASVQTFCAGKSFSPAELNAALLEGS